jgi:hypothetical protein
VNQDRAMRLAQVGPCDGCGNILELNRSKLCLACEDIEDGVSEAGLMRLRLQRARDVSIPVLARVINEIFAQCGEKYGDLIDEYMALVDVDEEREFLLNGDATRAHAFQLMKTRWTAPELELLAGNGSEGMEPHNSPDAKGDWEAFLRELKPPDQN